MRPEIQALRAAAVTLVVVYHVEPRLLPGGYVGVDVFFVISGFLMTAHISRGVLSADRFSLAGFYARRIRRLLPASLTVLLVVGLITLIALPKTMWHSTGKEIVSSVFYVQNWTLAASSVDYLAAGSAASPVQHFWSLSAEEQFYLVWPVLIMSAAAIGLRIARPRSVILLAVAVTTVVSFAYSVHYTSVSPAAAYFVTPTRAWEFGVGGLIALAVPAMRGPAWFRSMVSWIGVAAIIGSAVIFTRTSPFPGHIALIPVLGTAAVILAGDTVGRWAASRIANLRSVQFVGDISYSVYLWHWPLIVLVPLMINGPGYELPITFKLAIGAAAVPIGWLSKTLIEDRFRTTARKRTTAGFRRHRAPVFMTAAAGMLVAASPGVTAFGVSQSLISRAETSLARFIAEDPACAGAAALESRCEDRSPEGVQPATIIAREDAVDQECQQRADSPTPLRCVYGSEDPGATTVAVLGDSHANQWVPALTRIAAKHDWRLVTYLKSGCPYAVNLGPEVCREFNRNVAKRLPNEDLDMVITTARARPDYGSGDGVAEAADAFAAAWEPLIADGTRVYVLADTPIPASAGFFDPPSCLESGRDCTFSQSRALQEDPLVEAARRTEATLVDLNDRFCIQGMCPPVVGGVLVYRDSNHITAVYARSLADPLERRLLGEHADV